MTALPFSELVIASHNSGKVREIGELVIPFDVSIFSATELDLPEPEETGDTFEANAILKAQSAFEACGKASLADDSGLAVEALDGAPGIYSARWGGQEKNFYAAMEKVRAALMSNGTEPEGAKAHFVCVLALALSAQNTLTFRGESHGTLTFPPRGEKGFGYDPIFIPEGHSMTFAEIGAAEKHAISHRAQAFATFTKWLNTQ